MPYVKKLKQDRPEDQQQNIQLTESPVGPAASGGGLAGGTAEQQMPERQRSRPGYVSGTRYAAGNIEAAQRLAERIYQPLIEKGEAAQQQLQSELGAFEEKARAGYTKAPELVEKAALTPTALTQEQQQQLLAMRRGEYTSPGAIPEFKGVQEEEARMRALADLYGTSEGLRGQLPVDEGRKYTPGMRSFDVMMLRQSPAIRGQLEAQKLRADLLEQARMRSAAEAQAEVERSRREALEQGASIRERLVGARDVTEQEWQNRLQQAREQAAAQHEALVQAVQSGQDLSPEQLRVMDLTPEQYEQLRGAERVAAYGGQQIKTGNPLLRILAQAAIKNAGRTTPTAYERFDWTPYLERQSPEEIGYEDVLTPEELSRYQALTELAGVRGAGFVPTVVAGPEQRASDISRYNWEAAQKALQEFQAGAAKPLPAPPAKSCFAAGTPILMADGSFKNVEDLELGDELFVGGEVYGHGKAYNNDMYTYKGTLVSGSHAVLEDGKWLRVEDSAHATPADDTIVYPVVCKNHIIISNPLYISADMEEIDDTTGYNDVQRIEKLNEDVDRNTVLMSIVDELMRVDEADAA